MMVVQIEKPANMKLAMWFTELRSWFDKNNCQPAAFTPSGSLGDKLIFNVSFDDNSQARLFASHFPTYARATGGTLKSSEREDLLIENWGGSPKSL